jgi:hypothetical protein
MRQSFAGRDNPTPPVCEETGRKAELATNLMKAIFS